MRLKDEVFVLTGAQGGMGKATVNRFLEEGAYVAALDLNVDSLEKTDRLLPIAVNLTDENLVAKAFSQINSEFGKISGLVNIAGIAQPATSIEQVTLADWDKIMAVNATAPFLTCREVTPYLKEQGRGVIVNISSISMIRPRPGLNAYVASKGAVVSLSQALAIELAEYGIRVNVVNPGPSDTNMLGQFTAKGASTEDTKETIFKKSVPLGRLIQPIDIANSLVYLCSDEAAIVTGAVMNVDGGRGI
ncbi:SDR family NAD(P)-dependent oxidoreductase [Sutcliffiella rhizosphaerae]|uniref:4-formylbenzenesulfonate dehydrogenase TsaC1/TsaC2 n=1 Tax=Sutcliffiella rhizosphaerae TaxID=2880967 RepID=A0ABM8YTN2_9BACI|nr:glucose 1-dehydrogenase [Sutcliffiella rhizosphaerae]CAG9623322.1 4-formylbenzenesulfonate dehydrogenase TsaC1/TsaC2 [Sutcliffiella rhizosphaerae]